MAFASLPAVLNSTNTYQLNFSQACTSITPAIKLYNEYFCDNCSASETPDGEPIYPWTEPPRAWTNFWRTALETFPPIAHASARNESLLTDQNVLQWANLSTATFDFFYNPEVHSNNATWYADDIAIWGGCVGNKTLNKQDQSVYSDNSYDLDDMIEDCMSVFCCQIPLDSNLLSENKTAYEYYPTWNTADTCTFHTCQAATEGNPDLAGIGVSVPCLETVLGSDQAVSARVPSITLKIPAVTTFCNSVNAETYLTDHCGILLGSNTLERNVRHGNLRTLHCVCPRVPCEDWTSEGSIDHV